MSDDLDEFKTIFQNADVKFETFFKYLIFVLRILNNEDMIQHFSTKFPHHFVRIDQEIRCFKTYDINVFKKRYTDFILLSLEQRHFMDELKKFNFHFNDFWFHVAIESKCINYFEVLLDYYQTLPLDKEYLKMLIVKIGDKILADRLIKLLLKEYGYVDDLRIVQNNPYKWI